MDRFHSAQTRAKQQRQRILGHWLDGPVAWGWWITLTFKRNISDGEAVEALHGWLRTLAKEIGTHIHSVYGLERQTRGVLHFHLVLGVSGSTGIRLTRDRLRTAWTEQEARCGKSQIDEYRARGGATGYLSKEGDWNFRTGCPRQRACRKARGCVAELGRTR